MSFKTIKTSRNQSCSGWMDQQSCTNQSCLQLVWMNWVCAEHLRLWGAEKLKAASCWVLTITHTVWQELRETLPGWSLLRGHCLCPACLRLINGAHKISKGQKSARDFRRKEKENLLFVWFSKAAADVQNNKNNNNKQAAQSSSQTWSFLDGLWTIKFVFVDFSLRDSSV